MSPTRITLDFETFYGTKYTLKQLTYLEYINDPRFQIQGASITIDGVSQGFIWADAEGFDKYIKNLFPPGNDVELVCHNTAFDALILDIIFKVRPRFYRCTQSMFRGLAPQAKHSLAAMAEALWPNDESMRKGTELINFKDKRLEEFTKEDRREMESYATQDGHLTEKGYLKLVKYLPEDELDIIHDTLRLWIEPVIELDIEKVKEYEIKLAEETEQLIEKAGLPKKLLASRKQFVEHLENEVGIKIPTKISPTTGKPTPALGKNDFAFQQLRANTPDLKDVWAARLNVSSTGEHSRAKRLIQNAEWDNGWMRVALNYYGAHTGRFSGAQKINQQNFKRNSPLRLALKAPKNCYVYVADLSQIEARKLSWFAGEDRLVEDFRLGIDIYSKFASRIYKREIDRKKVVINEIGEEYYPDFLEGFVGKTCILGLGFGMGPPKFRNTMAEGSMGGPPIFFSEEQSKDIVYNVYRKTYPNIVDTWDACQGAIFTMAAGEKKSFRCLEIEPNRIILPNGMALNYPRLTAEMDDRGRYQFSYWNGKKVSKIYGGLLTENIIQALARITLMYQLKQIKSEIPELRFALQVHDELIFIGPQHGADERMEQLLGLMKNTPDWCKGLPVTAEGGYAPEYSK